jgi:hypothetical protein
MLKRIYLSSILILIGLSVFGQISPGELSEPHSHLEGISNCTKCHELGEKVNEDKCLACHQELKVRIDQKKGFHSSPNVYKKSCILCHSDHLTRKYDIVHLDKTKFDHQTTGFLLEGKHSQKQCADCHKPENIKEELIKKKKMTFLGLNSACLTCHADYHQETLSKNCTECHTFEGFKTAPKFDHTKAKFTLMGRHKQVDCKKCHEIGTVNGKAFQKFKGLQFNSCVNCHKDIHENKFGQNCVQCHSEDSFKAVKSIGQFDHNKTDFRLEGKHVTVSCKSCHKGSLISKIKYTNCTDCHVDFHKGQFNKRDIKSDCQDCHTVEGFKGSSFTIERHNQGEFKLEGAHVAIPCISCHQKGDEWQFQIPDKRCVICHPNIHKGIIDEKYMPGEMCDKCHTTNSWNNINFDHQITRFELKGKHKEQLCSNCHLVKNNDHQIVQKFNGFTGKCVECHVDIHQKQFDENGSADCIKCHGFANWKAEKFNHNLTRFKLEGGHLNVDCRKCHVKNTIATIPFVQYKNTEIKCISCHR